MAAEVQAMTKLPVKFAKDTSAACVAELVPLYNHEGLWPTTVMEGRIGSDARALGGALLPLHANFAPDRDIFLKAAV